MSRSSGPGFLAGAALGVLLGGALGLLFAPRSGQQTRRELVARGAARSEEASGSFGAEPTEGSPESPGELLDLGVGALDVSFERLGQAYDAARQAAEDARAQMSNEWARTKRGEG